MAVRNLRQNFAIEAKRKESKGNDAEVEVLTPSLRVELPYTYLIAWFMMLHPWKIVVGLVYLEI